MILTLNSPSDTTLSTQLNALARVADLLRSVKREEEHRIVVPSGMSAYTLFNAGVFAILEELRREGYLLMIKNDITPNEDAMVMSMEHNGAFDRIPFLESDILKNRKDMRGVLLYIIGELTDNIRDHARALYGVIRGTVVNQSLSLAIVDRGISIPGAYRAAGITLRDECEALTHAVEGISTKTVEERGTGLPSVRRIMREAFQGEFTILSAGVLLEDHGTPRCAASPFFWQGAIIYLTGTIPAHPINLYDYLTR